MILGCYGGVVADLKEYQDETGKWVRLITSRNQPKPEFQTLVLLDDPEDTDTPALLGEARVPDGIRVGSVFRECGFLSGAFGEDVPPPVLRKVAGAIGYGKPKEPTVVRVHTSATRQVGAIMLDGARNPARSPRAMDEFCEAVARAFPSAAIERAGDLGAVFSVDLEGSE